MKRTAVIFAFGMTSCAAMAGILDDAAKQFQELCAPRLAVPFEVPEKVRQEAGAECDEQALYYGFDGKPDPKAAFQCALRQYAHPKEHIRDAFAGPGMLSMLYANGLGVKRNIDLAERFVCENRWVAVPEVTGRIERLEAMRSAAQPERFDLCADATSGAMASECTNIEVRFKAAKRQREWQHVQMDWTPTLRDAFKPLQMAEAAFAEMRSGEEVDRSGTLRNALYFNELNAQQEQFLINVRSFSKQQIPKAGAKELETAEAEMQAELTRLRKSYAVEGAHGTITMAGIGKTQAAWESSSNAWATFSAQAWPRLDVDRIRWRLTRQRIHQLKSL